MSGFARLNLNLALTQIVELSLATLFFLVPLIFIPSTSELFEYNKMYLTYALAAIIFLAEIGRLLTAETPQIKRPALALISLIFLAGLAVTTFHSVDTHISLFGYYGRFYGGLFSYLALGIIFFSLTQLSKLAYLSLVKVSLLSGVVISIWGILEHFGHSPSCILLNHTFDANCWVQDVKARVFATLGQPNWLSAYLAMLFPWAAFYYFESKEKLPSLLLLLSTVTIFTCFIFTFSRGGNFGLIAAVAILAAANLTYLRNIWRRVILLAVPLVAITIIFATPLGQQLFKTPPPRQTGTLEAGDETGNIRLIVWRGAWDIFRANPLTGTGLDTFGESFYQFRPVEMNKTSEWDFLFNRAHNEYLNFLSTTGLVGTIPYLLLLGVFIWKGFRLSRKSGPNRLLYGVALASTGSYLVQNIFSFTVVTLALLFTLNLASLSLDEKRAFNWTWTRKFSQILRSSLAATLVLPTLIALGIIFNFWRADLSYAQGSSYNESGDAGSADRELTQAVSLNPFEPNYIIQLAFARSNLASESLSDLDASSAEKLSQTAIQISPDSLSIRRLASQVYENLSDLDPKYLDLAEQSRQKEVDLAPTDPEVRFELGQFYQKNNQTDRAIENYLASLKLKDDYTDPLKELAKIYLNQNDQNSAKIYVGKLQKIAPTDPEVISLSQKVGS